MSKSTKRFCCVALETGIKWCGYLGAVLNLIVIGLILVRGFEAAKNNPDHTAVWSTLKHHSLVDGDKTLIVTLVTSAINVVTCIMLVVAVNRRKRYFLLPWLIINFVTAAFWAIVFSAVVFPTALILSPILFVIYLWYSVFSMHNVLRAEELNQIKKAFVTEAEA